MVFYFWAIFFPLNKTIHKFGSGALIKSTVYSTQVKNLDQYSFKPGDVVANISQIYINLRQESVKNHQIRNLLLHLSKQAMILCCPWKVLLFIKDQQWHVWISTYLINLRESETFLAAVSKVGLVSSFCSFEV